MLSSIPLYACCLFRRNSRTTDYRNDPVEYAVSDIFGWCTQSLTFEVLSYVVFIVSPKKGVKWTEIQRTWQQRKSVFLEISFPPNNSSKCLIVAVAVWGVAPSCWNHWLSNRIFWRRCNSPGKVSITLWYRS